MSALNISLHLATEYNCDHGYCRATILVRHHAPNLGIPASAYAWDAAANTRDANTCRNANQLALHHWKTSGARHYCPDHQPPTWARTGTES